MADIFEQVAMSQGYGWHGKIADELKAYIDSAVAESANEFAVTPDPATPGSYLIGE